MRRIFTFSFIAAAMAATSLQAGAQCSLTTVNFSGTSTEGFTGAQTSGSGTFSPLAVTTNELRSTVTASGSNTYVITSATYSVPAISPSINFTFAYDNGPQATVTNVQYSIRYINTSGVITQTTPVSYVSGTCLTIPKPLDFSGNSYQVLAIYTVTDGSGSASNSYIALDNFGTNGTLAQAVLPVKFQSLDARTSNNSISLKWTVGTEENVAGYEIEKSIDNRNYSKIGFVDANGSTAYSFVDSKISSVAYYRIKSVDMNGKYTYSTVALVKAGQAMIVLKAFPTPFVNSLSIQHATANSNSLITISSEDGRLIKSIIPAIGTQQTDVDLSTSKSGMYLVRFTDGSGTTQTLKVIKQL